MRMLFIFAILMTICSSCSPYMAQEIRLYNREQLGYLEIGMPREIVLETMGTETFATDVAINNPYRIEMFKSNDGTMVEVLFYYTDVKDDDNAISDSEMTPLVLIDDELVGWGWFCLRQYLPAESLPKPEAIAIIR